MKYADYMRGEIVDLPVYQPGKPTEVLARQSGLNPADIVKLASNENPVGPSPLVTAALRQQMEGMALYPDNSGYELVRAISQKRGCSPEQITLAAGSNEIFYLLCDLFAAPGVEVVVGEYAFISYRIAAQMAGARLIPVPMPNLCHDLAAMYNAITDKTRLVFLPNPNNPTGTAVPVAEVAAFARSLPPHVVFCYDAAYAEYEDEILDVNALLRQGVRIVETRTFSKIYGLAGLRMGYALSDVDLAGLLNQVRPPFNTASIAQAAACIALDDDAWLEHSRQVNATGRSWLTCRLAAMGLRPSGEHGNFLLVEVADGVLLTHALQALGVIVRSLAAYGLPRYVRISIGTEDQNNTLVRAMESVLQSDASLVL